jgi:hypothetical protein
MTTIISSDDFTTPIAVQQSIRDRYAFTKEAEIEVRKNKQEFEIYRKDKYQFSLDELGNEIPF